MKTLRFALPLIVGLVTASAQTAYTLTDLGVLPGHTASYATAVNASGQVVGYSANQDSMTIRAFLYANGRMTDLGTLGGTFSMALGVNASGQVVGGSLAASADGRAFLYSGGRMTDLGAIGGSYSWAAGINNSGQIVGESGQGGFSQFRAFLYANGQMTDLGTLGGGMSSAACINESGQIAGRAELSSGFFGAVHAFLYSSGRMTDLGTLGGSGSWANGINPAGQVVGASYLSSSGSSVPIYDQHAFLYANGKMTDLGTLAPYGSSEANSINASGQIVGEVFDYYSSNDPDSTDQRAFIYTAGRMYDLNKLLTGTRGWTLLQATAINDAGLIAGLGLNTAGEFRAFLLVPSTLPPDPVPPVIQQAPSSQNVAPGAAVTFGVTTSDAGVTYQWKKNGVPISGATSPAYAIASATPGDMGFYSVVVANRAGTIESLVAILTLTAPAAATTATSSRLANLSTRGLVQAGGDLTVGFVISGSRDKPVLVRAVGPSLAGFGVGGALADPRLDLIPSNVSAAATSNDDWGGGATLANAFSGVGAFALSPSSKDAALLATLPAAAYTARITSSAAAGSGIAIAEVYDRDSGGAGGQLVNLSTLGFVGTEANALVPGFVIAGTSAKLLLIRAVGPTLAQFGVTGTLADPQFAMIPLGQTFTVASNDNWDSSAATATAFARAGAFPLQYGSRDAALVVRLPPGGYTVQVSGAGGTTGRALVEIYDLDP